MSKSPQMPTAIVFRMMLNVLCPTILEAPTSHICVMSHSGHAFLNPTVSLEILVPKSNIKLFELCLKELRDFQQ
jgi:hypothetical protein